MRCHAARPSACATSACCAPRTPLTLQLGYNKVSSWAKVAPLAAMPALTTVYLEHNPISREYAYRMQLTKLVPTLEKIDMLPVSRR